MKLNTLLFAICPNIQTEIYEEKNILFNDTWDKMSCEQYRELGAYKVMGIDPKRQKNKLYLSIEVIKDEKNGKRNKNNCGTLGRN